MRNIVLGLIMFFALSSRGRVLLGNTVPQYYELCSRLKFVNFKVWCPSKLFNIRKTDGWSHEFDSGDDQLSIIQGYNHAKRYNY